MFSFVELVGFSQVQVGTNFKITGQLPIDQRFVFEDTVARNALSTNFRYDGLFCYTTSDSSNWQLKGGITNSH